jgi:hypothetical protein
VKGNEVDFTTLLEHKEFQVVVGHGAVKHPMKRKRKRVGLFRE